MSYGYAKIRAQEILLTARKKGIAVCIFSAALRLICIFCTAVSVYSLLHLQTYAPAANSVYAAVGFYALFSVAVPVSAWCYALLVYLQKRWFYENTKSAMPIFAFFCRLRFRDAVKIGFAYYLKKVLCIGTMILYMLPFLLSAGGFLYALRTAAVSTFLFYATLAFLGVLFVLGLYFGFAAVQKYTFCEALFAVSPYAGLVDTFKMSKHLTRGIAFRVVRFKLRFVPWLLCGLLIFPLFYALPYYRQSIACLSETVLDKNHLLPQKQKPIVFFLPARASA